MAPSLFGYCETGSYDYDPDRAKELLEEAGFDFSREIKLTWIPGTRDRDQSVEVILENLKAIGVNAVANQSDDLDWLHAWSPYHWAYGDSPLANGAAWGGLGLLYGLSAALLVIAVIALNRRDLRG